MKDKVYHNNNILELGNENIIDQKYSSLSDYASFPKEIDRFLKNKNFNDPLVADDSKTLIIPKSVNISGGLNGAEKVIIYGNFEYNDTRNIANVMHVMPTGSLIGNGIIKVLIISGTVEGDFNITEKLIIKNGGRLVGNVKYKDIVIEEGGKILGKPNQVVSHNDFTKSTPMRTNLRYGGSYTRTPTVRNISKPYISMNRFNQSRSSTSPLRSLRHRSLFGK